MSKLKELISALANSQFGRALFRHGWPDNPKDQALLLTNDFSLHMFPVKVKKHAPKFWYTWCLGGIALTTFIVLTLTGIMLMFYYVPSTHRAYQDMIDLRYVVTFGRFMRNLHRWTAHVMVFAVFFHMCRVFITGSYKPPREMNWVVGIVLLLVTTLLSYTGYLLPWDQLAYWGVQVGTKLAGYVPVIGADVSWVLLGGKNIDQNALLRFYVLHTVVLPAVLTFFIGVHFYRIRKDGGISGPL